jgi:glycosyltransferase involved in cell wall biosynthesis
MRIAYLNTLGIPARYRGFETCVEELSTRLAKKGHDITVYCASNLSPRYSSYRGVRLISVPYCSAKFVDYPLRQLLSTLDAVLRHYDILHYFGTDSSVLAIVPRMLSQKLVMSLDGLSWNRSSYPDWVRNALRISSWLPLYFTHASVVDSVCVREWYRTRYGRPPIYIPYGAKVSPRGADPEVLKKFGVENDQYVLFVGVLVREKGVHHLIRAFNELDIQSELQLVIVGGDPYASAYELILRKMAGKNVRFLGRVYGSEMDNIFKGARLYVSASELEGTSPALLSAMGFGNCVLVSDIPENIETIGDAGLTFRNRDTQDLRDKMSCVVSDSDLILTYRKRSVERIERFYSWDLVAERMEGLYLSLAEGSDRKR